MEGNEGVIGMGFPLFSWLGTNERASNTSREASESRHIVSGRLGRGDVNSEMISTATGLSVEEIRELFD